jgi:hypothetical protein
MRAEELLETFTDEQLKAKVNGCFIQAENTNVLAHRGPEERQYSLTEADFYLKALASRHDARIAQRDFLMEVAVIALIGIEIVLSVYGLWEGHQQGKLIEKQTMALTHMDTSSAATATAMQAARDSLKSLAEAQAASLKILQEQQAEHAKKPRLALYVGKTPLAEAIVNPVARNGSAQGLASFDLFLKNIGDAPVGTFRLRAVVPVPAVFETDRLITVLEPDQPGSPTYTVTVQQPLLPAGETARIHVNLFVPNGTAPFKVSFTVNAMELQAVTPLGSLTVLAPTH